MFYAEENVVLEMERNPSTNKQMISFSWKNISLNISSNL